MEPEWGYQTDLELFVKRYHVLSKHNALLRMSPLKLAHPAVVRFTLRLKYRGDFSNLESS